MKKPLEVVKKDVARFRLSVRGFCYLFGLLTRNNDASAMPRHTLLRTTAHVRRAAVATVVEQLMFVACLGSQQARTTDTQRELFFESPNLLGLGRQIGPIFGQIISTHFGTVSPLLIFSIIQPSFLQKAKPLYPHPKSLFRIGI